jgi:hypothetical protein
VEPLSQKKDYAPSNVIYNHIEICLKSLKFNNFIPDMEHNSDQIHLATALYQGLHKSSGMAAYVLKMSILLFKK